jgi:hypothetical protein
MEIEVTVLKNETRVVPKRTSDMKIDTAVMQSKTSVSPEGTGVLISISQVLLQAKINFRRVDSCPDPNFGLSEG